MTVYVTHVSYEPGSTIAIATGLDDDGNVVRFAGDWRPMQHLAEAVHEYGSVPAYVEPWQVIG